MLTNGDMTNALILFLIAVVGVLLAYRWLVGVGAGLVPAFLACLWMMHWPGALIHTLPWYVRSDAPMVRAGFQISLYAVLAFGVGALVLPLVRALTPEQMRAAPRYVATRLPNKRLIRLYLAVGACGYVLTPFGSLLPSLGALMSMASLLVVVALALAARSAWQSGNTAAMAGWLAAGLLIPIYTAIVWGFLSFGMYAFVALCCIVATFARARPLLIVICLATIYMGVSFYVSYMRDRKELRALVWGEQGFEQRIVQFGTTIATIDLFEIGNTTHLDLINERLNQNVLDGAAVLYLDAGLVPYANGETLWKAVVALVPRAIWPDKPITAGGNTVVSTYTGMEFDRDTTVGIGQVMECYINFGTTGVVVGFLILGMLVSCFDVNAALALQRGNWQRFAFWLLGGIGFIQPNGALFEISASVGAGLFVAWFVNTFLAPMWEMLVPARGRSARFSQSPARQIR